MDGEHTEVESLLAVGLHQGRGDALQLGPGTSSLSVMQTPLTLHFGSAEFYHTRTIGDKMDTKMLVSKKDRTGTAHDRRTPT